MIGITKGPRDSYRGEASEDGEAVRIRDSPRCRILICVATLTGDIGRT